MTEVSIDGDRAGSRESALTPKRPIAPGRQDGVTRLLLGLVIVLGLVVLGGLLAISTLVPPDEEPPEEMVGRLDEFRTALAEQLELPPSIVRFTAAERGANEFVVLHFEVRAFPGLIAEGAYLVSRCTPLRALDPWSMGGGRGVTNWDTDHELVFLRAHADDPCP